MTKNVIATHYCSLGTVVHGQTNTINLWLLPYKCIVMQKYLASFTITVAPYMAGMVNHVMNNETAKITDTIYLTRDIVIERGEAEEKRALLC